MPETTLDRILSQLEGVKRTATGATARCPAHADARSSLSVGVGEDARVLLKCFAGCTAEAIVHALGIELRDLFSTRSEVPRHLSVGDLARHKAIPEEFLRGLGIVERDGGLLIPYRLEDGSPATRHRLRSSL